MWILQLVCTSTLLLLKLVTRDLCYKGLHNSIVFQLYLYKGCSYMNHKDQPSILHERRFRVTM